MKTPNLIDRSLIQAILSLSEKERKGFRIYLSCKLFNTNQRLLDLYDQLLNKVVRSKRKLISPEEFVSGTGFNPNRLHIRFSQLFKLLGDFLVVNNRNQYPKNYELMKFLAFSQSGIPKYILEREFRKTQKFLKNPPLSGEDSHAIFKMELMRLSTLAQGPRKTRRLEFDAALNQLDEYYLITQLRLYCAIVNQSLIFGKKPHPQPNNWPAFSRQLDNADSPMIAAYGLALRLLRGEEDLEVISWKLLRVLKREVQNFGEEDAWDLFGYLLNFCSQQVMKGDHHIRSLQIETYRSAIASGVLIQRGKISAKYYKNIVSAFSFAGLFVEAGSFLHTYKSCIEGSEPEITFQLSSIIFRLHQRQYDGLEVELLQIIMRSTEDQFWGIEARKLLLKYYFEQYIHLSPHQIESCKSLIESFRMLIERRESLSPRHKAKYLNFAKILRILFKLMQEPERKNEKYASLLERIGKMEELANRPWIAAFINRLGG